jgi:tetratricopeptide (TPR) repeat protein
VHELAHDLSQWFMPMQPLWFSEGMASFLEGLEFNRSTSVAQLGEVSKVHVEFLKRSGFVVRTDKLFSAKQSIHEDPRETGSFYASCWLLTHYLINQHNDGFARFQQEIARLNDWRTAWDAALPGLTPELLNDNLVAYTQRAQFSVLEAPIERAVFDPQVRALSPAQAHGLQARTAWMLGNQALALEEVRRARALEPGELNAALTRFFVQPPTATQARADIAREIVAAYPSSADALMLQAQMASAPAERAAALANAQAVAPDRPDLRRLLAQAALQEGRAEEALDHAQVVLRRSPMTPSVLSLQMRAMAANDGCDIAKKIADTADGLYGEQCRVTSSSGGEIPCSSFLRETLTEVCAG